MRLFFNASFADADKSIEFYTQVLGMKELRRADSTATPAAFVGYGDENSTVLELTYNWDTDSYDLGIHAAISLSSLMIFLKPAKTLKLLAVM